MKFFTWLLFALMFLSGCATPPVRQTAHLAPEQNDFFKEQQQNAQVCSAPAEARPGIDKNFRYGCFCGKNYPDIAPSVIGRFSEWPKSEQDAYLGKYFAIKPIDDIDAACQAHDICWIINDRSELACNERFTATLEQLRKRWKASIGWLETNRWQFRCATLASDIGFAALAVMKYDTEDEARKISEAITRALASPVTVLYASTVQFGTFLQPYPHPDEKCVAQTVIP